MVLLVVLAAPTPEAHKMITSKYNYNEHVFPILRDRCARCHYQGGPTPMSLTTYQDALPWAESMREQLVGEKMPPWYADATGPSVKGGHMLSTRELDVIVTWAAGGTPVGDLNAKLPAVPPPAPWKSGPPDLQVKMPEVHNVPVGTQEEDVNVTIPTGVSEEKWIKAVDLQPGDTSMVRDAVIGVENGPVLAAWVPGHDAIAAPNGTAFKLPANAKLTLKIHYKKSWQDEQNAKSDQTVIGLYFTDPPLSGKSIESLEVKGPDTASATEAVTFSGALKTGRACWHCVPASTRRIRRHRRSGAAERPPRNAHEVPGAAAAVVSPLLAGRAGRVAGSTKLEVKDIAGSGRRVLVDRRLQKRYPLQVTLDFVAP